MKYDNLLKAAKKDPTKADFKELRLAYAKTDGYEPYTTKDVDPSVLNEAFNKGDMQNAIKEIERILSKRYIDIYVHGLAANVYTQVGDGEKARYHILFSKGLLNSVLRSGDGRSVDTAFVVVMLQEEYAAIHFLGGTPGNQALMVAKGHTLDVIDVNDTIGKGPATKMYFNIDAFRKIGML